MGVYITHRDQIQEHINLLLDSTQHKFHHLNNSPINNLGNGEVSDQNSIEKAKKKRNKKGLEIEAEAEADMEVYQDPCQVTSTGFLGDQETPHAREIAEPRTRISSSGSEDLQNLQRFNQISGVSTSASEILSRGFLRPR